MELYDTKLTHASTALMPMATRKARSHRGVGTSVASRRSANAISHTSAKCPETAKEKAVHPDTSRQMNCIPMPVEDAKAIARLLINRT